MKRIALALAALALLLAAAPAVEATCWIDCSAFYCRSTPLPSPEPISFEDFVRTLAEEPIPQEIKCCVCCSPPGGPVTCTPLPNPLASPKNPLLAPALEQSPAQASCTAPASS